MAVLRKGLYIISILLGHFVSYEETHETSQPSLNTNGYMSCLHRWILGPDFRQRYTTQKMSVIILSPPRKKQNDRQCYCDPKRTSKNDTACEPGGCGLEWNHEGVNEENSCPSSAVRVPGTESRLPGACENKTDAALSVFLQLHLTMSVILLRPCYTDGMGGLGKYKKLLLPYCHLAAV